MNPGARFALARHLHSGGTAPLGEVFSFVSGLYFRGKEAYARRFARPPEGAPGVWVITPSRGLLPVEFPVGLPDLEEFRTVDVSAGNAEYRVPMERSAHALSQGASEADAVLLGSIATGKYAEVLMEAFGERLYFPEEFIGRGDMSRGGLMLRCVAEARELTYVPLLGAVRTGRRPPRLAPVRKLPPMAS